MLISQKIPLPDGLEQEIVKEGHIKYLLEFYLSETNVQPEMALDMVLKNLPKSVQTLADLDL